MCAICGCGSSDADGPLHHPKQAGGSHAVGHHGSHDAEGEHEHVLSDGTVLRHSHPPTLPTGPSRVLEVERALLEDNDAQAARNRQRLVPTKTLTLNLMASPGAGKTTLIEATLRRLEGSIPVAVIEGDQQTSLDAERVRRAGAQAVQINTGRACHLDASMIDRALGELTLPPDGLLFIENVGNLVCPASFDLGEHKRVVLASVTEGEDKPLKYPDMFARADLVVVSKIDLLPHLDFDCQRFAEYARRVQPRVELLFVSARSGDQMSTWLDWLTVQRRSLR